MAARSTAVAHPCARRCRRSRATRGARQRTCLSNLVQPVRERCAGTAGQLVAIAWPWGANNAQPRAHNRARPNTIKSITPITNLAKFEDEFLTWVETELVSELLKRLMLVQCKLYEMELKKKVDEHRANFDPAELSANYYHMCIRFLDRELKEMIKQHRALRNLAGLPLLGYENPREATGRIVCANCHLANKPVDIEVPQAVLPDTVFEAVVRIPYDKQVTKLLANADLPAGPSTGCSSEIFVLRQ
ncbi:Apocytochrome F [Dorcoceras hygrometricum]|uniref:Apocytochrome F n=1 Tax=Dorcoceras hygrometricum TaxID=472368 RepID=A0A2Z7CMX4_9LAMI|nr:Apocytochrome F [Dorcoceras hygrometricum]